MKHLASICVLGVCGLPASRTPSRRFFVFKVGDRKTSDTQIQVRTSYFFPPHFTPVVPHQGRRRADKWKSENLSDMNQYTDAPVVLLVP